MSKRVLVSSAIGAVVLGTAVAVGGYAMASGATQLTVENGAAAYVVPSAKGAGKFSYTADVSDDSGVREVRVLAWPVSSKLDPTEAELEYVDTAACRPTSDETSRCTYTLKVTHEDATYLAKGTWQVSVLATARDGDTKFVPRAATFVVR
ncbi:MULTISPECIES: DUF5707 domain-containing protein [unclassified Streptomyces]|uniref:DUF5707 domain-containing protein n=1 Tax=unclassified Streptomyces TaxID=2593676 RepID=UPI000C27AACF|nr:DUF5707 domain-containing protein [Streptomyces sp. CB01373]PJM91801.1 hypothetical protein CG719_31815 [Streptomyces sp. CB01373]